MALTRAKLERALKTSTPIKNFTYDPVETCLIIAEYLDVDRPVSEVENIIIPIIDELPEIFGEEDIWHSELLDGIWFYAESLGPERCKNFIIDNILANLSRFDEVDQLQFCLFCVDVFENYDIWRIGIQLCMSQNYPKLRKKYEENNEYSLKFELGRSILLIQAYAKIYDDKSRVFYDKFEAFHISHEICPQVMPSSYRYLTILQYLFPLISKENFSNHEKLVTKFLQVLNQNHTPESISKFFNPDLHKKVFRGLLLDFCQKNYNQELTRAVITLRRSLSRSDDFHKSVSFVILSKTQNSAFVVDALRDWLQWKKSNNNNFLKAEYYKCVKSCVETFDLEELLGQEEFMKRYTFISSTVMLCVQGIKCYGANKLKQAEKFMKMIRKSCEVIRADLQKAQIDGNNENGSADFNENAVQQFLNRIQMLEMSVSQFYD